MLCDLKCKLCSCFLSYKIEITAAPTSRDHCVRITQIKKLEYLTHSKHSVNVSSHYNYRIHQYWANGGVKVEKLLSTFMSFLIKGETKHLVSLHEFWCKTSVHFHEPSEVPALIPTPVDLGRYTSTGISIHLHTQSPRTHSCLNPPGKPKLERESVSSSEQQ